MTARPHLPSAIMTKELVNNGEKWNGEFERGGDECPPDEIFHTELQDFPSSAEVFRSYFECVLMRKPNRER